MKRDTREHILQTSLELFNALGEPRVTTNQIALEADISPGNLYYHFRSKHDIVLELFKRFLAQFQPLLEVPENASLEAEDLWFQLHLSFELKGQFRFLYRNLKDLTEQVPDLGKAFLGLLSLERRAVSELIENLEKQDKLHINAAERPLLLNNLMLALTYWIPYADLFEAGGMENGAVQSTAIAGVLQMLVPYLGPHDRQQFNLLAQRYHS
ncbi:MAG TPA: TetR/AcrR family transcriptional regulator [Xanthomonadales bacterium]|nr:TetR/AcrR family transcriptional regulator [Xanthomonadales bacterium]